MICRHVLFFATILGLAGDARAQAAVDMQPYSRRNTYTAFLEYSNDSSHIILGDAPNRKLAGIGAQYERRLVSKPFWTLGYMAEFRPFILSSDPTATFSETYFLNGSNEGTSTETEVVFQCKAGSSTSTETGSYGTQLSIVTTVCFRQQTLAQGGSPVGFRFHIFPDRSLQLTFSSNGGYMYSTKAIPIPTAGSFNFTFNFGGGLEYFYSPRRSVRLEYLVQHYSNHYTAPSNPGVDSGFVRLAYAFGH